MSEKIDIYDISLRFLAAFFRDKRVLQKFKSKILMFELDAIQKGLDFLVSKCVSYFDRYRELANKEYYLFVIEQEIRDDSLKDILVKIVENIFSEDLSKDNYKVDEFVKVLKKQVLESTLIEVENIDDLEKRVKILDERLKILKTFDKDIEVWDFASTFEERERERKSFKRQKILRTGIKDLDDQVKMLPCTITSFLAPFKRYKSITLTHIGFAAILQGFNVLHLNFEGRKEMWEARYDSRFSGVDYSIVISSHRPPELEERLWERIKLINKLTNRLKIARGIPFRTNVDDIEMLLKHLEVEEGFKADVVIIDYFQVMGCTRYQGIWDTDDWKVMGAIAWDLVDFANRMNLIIVGAIQTKAAGISASNIKQEHYSRSIMFPQAIDNMIAINQTPEERREGIIRFSPLFIRDGEIKKEHCKVEAELWKMNIAKESERLWQEFEIKLSGGEIGIKDEKE